MTPTWRRNVQEFLERVAVSYDVPFGENDMILPGAFDMPHLTLTSTLVCFGLGAILVSHFVSQFGRTPTRDFNKSPIANCHNQS